MIECKQDLKDYILADSKNYASVIGWRKYWKQRVAQPINDQWYIWQYIKTMRYTEFHTNMGKSSTGLCMIYHKVLMYWYRFSLRKLSRITGFQIGLNTCGRGLVIWHWGSIIINENSRIGDYCTLYPGVLLGHKVPGESSPYVGNNCFLASGCKLIGNIKIGSNTVIAQNAVVFKNIPDNCVVAGNPACIIKQDGKRINKKQNESTSY